MSVNENIFHTFGQNNLCMLTKQHVIQTIQALPDTFSIEEIIDQLVLLQKIELGLEQANRGEGLTSSEAKKKLKKWLK